MARNGYLSRLRGVAAALGLVILAGCGGSAADSSSAGDIPDTQAFVTFTDPGGAFTVDVPEGWARTDAGGAVTFSDRFNRIVLETSPAANAPTVQSVERDELPAIRAAVANFRPGTTTTVTRNGGGAVLATYQADSAPDAVTGKVLPLAFERYDFWNGGREVSITLSAPVGSDNVDPWRRVTDSLRWK